MINKRVLTTSLGIPGRILVTNLKTNRKILRTNFISILKVIPWLILFGVVAHLAQGEINTLIDSNINALHVDAAYYIGLIGGLGYLSYNLAQKKPMPSFVMALFVGIAAQPLLSPVADHKDILQEIVNIAAALILFQGGLGTSFKNFKRLFWKIFLLAFPGVLITAYLLSFAIQGTNAALGTTVSVTTMVLLGGLLASTDPASIIPLFQGLRFKKSTTKDIIVCESAMNDVVGAVLTLALVGFVTASGVFSSIFSGYNHLFVLGNIAQLLKELGFGVIAGLIGYLGLEFFSRHTKKHGRENGSHAFAFLSIVLLTFFIAILLGGSGYLAAFSAGLVFKMSGHLKQTERFFNGVIDGIAKPAIFLLLGAIVDLQSLIHYAAIGLIVGLVFIFAVRPLMVFLMLGGFTKFGKEHLSKRQLLFISFIRETGAIPAVLLVTVTSLNIPGTEALLPIGMWVILLTLVIQPPLTPFVAKKLNLVVPVEAKPADPELVLKEAQG